jgi:hypothetical protein
LANQFSAINHGSYHRFRSRNNGAIPLLTSVFSDLDKTCQNAQDNFSLTCQNGT